MNTMQIGTIALLKSAVLQQACPLPADFDLEAAYPELKRHHMDALLYEGAVLCGIPTDLPVMKQLFQNYCRSLLASEGQMREVRRIFAAFDQQRIDYMPLKGCKMKALYPKPELRTMGDADILIRLEQYDSIVPIMTDLGFRAGMETDHELQWLSNALFVELHKRVVPTRNKDFYAYFGEGWKLALRKEGNRYTMSPEDEMVYLFVHFAKHYQAGGIGCRYVLDLWMFLRANPDLNEEKVKGKLAKIQIQEFYENIRRLIAVWFEEEHSNIKIDFITDFIFSSGSWGRIETKAASAGIRSGAHKKSEFHAKITYLFFHLFPSVDSLKNKYVVLRTAPWLLPLVWLYRPFYKILNKRERYALSVHKRRMRILTPATLRTYQDALQYVGLDHQF